MKLVILAGGRGTRLSEETLVKPKPMVEIGEQPILWHIMKLYSHYGFNDFVILLGYKGYLIKEYFANYCMHRSSLEIDLRTNTIKTLDSSAEPWKITLLDTGLQTATGGRIAKAKHIIGDEPFMMTYGDGIGNVNIRELVEFHKKNKKLATITSVMPQGRFGILNIDNDNQVKDFKEKPKDSGFINGGFFVLEPKVFDYISGDDVFFEQAPLENLAKDNELISYKHGGFWKPMDTLKDKMDLEELWINQAPWKVW